MDALWIVCHGHYFTPLLARNAKPQGRICLASVSDADAAARRASSRARTGPVKLITRSNGSTQSRKRLSPSSGDPRTGGPAVRFSAERRWADLLGCVNAGGGCELGSVAFRAKRPEGGGCKCLGIFRSGSRRLNFANLKMPAASLSAHVPDISSGRVARKTSLPPSASSSVASLNDSCNFFRSRFTDFTITTGSTPS
jgi:hypothetical protein